MGVLALPATAIRRVNAGLIVGNPVGSSGTRAKALTSAELKAIIEASGISYLPLSGGTLTGALSLGANALTCGAITSSGNLAIRNALNAMTAEVFKTYTSGTSFESLCFKTSASVMQIGSAIGSAGGTNRPVQLGHFNSAGAFTSGLSVAIDGQVTIASNLLFAGAVFRSDANTGMQCSAAGNLTLQISGTQILGSGNVNEVTVRQAALLGFSSSAANVTSSPDAGIRRATGPALVVVANSGLQVRNLANSADAALTCSTIVASSDLTLTPSSSRTLSTNGQFSIEMTSNTAGNLVYRGSDGTTRRMALTFS